MTTKRHKVGKGKRRRNPQHHFEAIRKLGADMQAVSDAYHAGKIDSSALRDRSNAIQKRLMAAQDEARTPFYKSGDTVESKWGDRARIDGANRTDWGSLQYSITRGQDRGENIRDIWPAEVIVKKVAP